MIDVINFATLQHKKNKTNLRIDWNQCAIFKKLTQIEWNNKVDYLQNDNNYNPQTFNGYGYKTNISYWSLGTYRIYDNENQHQIFLRETDGRFYVYTTYNDDDKNDEDSIRGYKAYKEVDDMFYAQYGIHLAAAYGTMPKGEFEKQVGSVKFYHYELEKCVDALPAVIQFDSNYAGITLGSVYKADVSSAYPYQLTLPLPDANKLVIKTGQILPHEDEVAFWINSGHTIEGRKGGVDTRKLQNHPLYKDRNKFIDTDDDITFLMKYSEFSLKDIMNTLYNERKTNPLAKQAMVKFIGMLRSRKHFQTRYMGHIAAVVYARHIAAMCSYYDQLIAEKNYPVMYATDSIIWLGHNSAAATTDKKLGNFCLEYANAKALMYACGVYAIQTKNELAMVRHQGLPKEFLDNNNIELKNLKDFENLITKQGINCVYYDEESHKFTAENNKLIGVI